MESGLVIGDAQIPCHDPLAWEVALQIGEDLKPDVAVINGDFIEWRHISTHYQARDLAEFGRTAAEERTLAREMMEQFRKRVKAKKYKFNEGNHEWRLFRAISQTPQVMKLLGIKEIARAVCTDAVLGITALGFEYSGEYPAGCWLFGSGGDRDVFVHHSYMTRKKSGYMAHAELEMRGCSVIIGHGERMACVWKRLMGRWVFGCEGGNLSILGEPKKGQGIYASVPFNQPEFLDRQQGLTVVYREGDRLFPVPVPIHNGRAVFNGKLYKA